MRTSELLRIATVVNSTKRRGVDLDRHCIGDKHVQGRSETSLVYEHLFGKYHIALDTVSITIPGSAGAKRSPTDQMGICGTKNDINITYLRN